MEPAHVPTPYLLRGKAAAGKSALARRPADRPATLLVGENQWTSTLFAGELKTVDDHGRLSARLRSAMAPHIVDIPRLGLSVVLDFPANTVEQRSRMLSLIARAEATRELHVLDVPDAMRGRRPRERNAGGDHPFQVNDAESDSFTSSFVVPGPEEGFNVVRHTLSSGGRGRSPLVAPDSAVVAAFGGRGRGGDMVARVHTVAFQGVDVLDIDVEVQISSGLPDKAVGESRDRVRGALNALGLALPPRRITVNLAPADVLKEGSHFDLPIALGLLLAMGVIPADAVAGHTVLGELSLDGRINRVDGVLAAAIASAGSDRPIICPAACGGEAAWAAGIEVLAPPSLLALVNHVKGTQVLAAPEPALESAEAAGPDLADIKGQETAKRALEIAAAGGHNLLMVGPPGAGKSMLAQRLPGLLPPLSPAEALEVSMIHSVAGALEDGRLMRRRPFRDPHHTASVPALVGGGMRARPGEISLAHHGVLFLDELPEFQRGALEALRQPLETGRAAVARANTHVTYPARVQLVAAMNPCRCGYLDDAGLACSRAPRCARDYQSRISGPLFDRIDLHVDVPAVNPADLSLPPPAEGTAEVAARVARARAVQAARYAPAGEAGRPVRTNADADGTLLEAVAAPDAAGRALLGEAAERMRLTARGYHRVLRVARTLADLDGADAVARIHVAEALAYRRVAPGR